MSKKIIKTTTTVTEEVVDSTNKTLIACVLDRSGSMSSVIGDAIGGFNEFLKKQRELKEEASMTIAFFEDWNNYELLHNNVNIHDVKPLTKEEWRPGGFTALYDAIGKTIKKIDDEIFLLKKKNRPDKILFAIVTDGHENDSREYNHSTIMNLINQKKKEDWQFVFIGADQDAYSVGTSFGVAGGNTLNYANTSKGTKDMFKVFASATSSYRSLSKLDENFTYTSSNLFNQNQTIHSAGNCNITTGVDTCELNSGYNITTGVDTCKSNPDACKCN